jgi:hypothetical protein
MRRVAREADGGEAFQLPAHSGNRISPHSIVQEELLHDLLGVLHPSAYYSLEYFLKEDWREIQIDAEQEQEEQEQEEQEQE